MGRSDDDTALPYYQREPQVMRLPTLLAAMRDGALRVPDFQRGFVWKAKQRLGLFDSIAKGFPIGTILVWRTSRPEHVGTVDHLGPLGLVATRGRSRSAELILDGQQRLTTLFTALSPELPEQDGPWDDLLAHAVRVYGSEEKAREWAVYAELANAETLGVEENEGDEFIFRQAPRRGPVPPHYVPLYLLLKNIPFSRFLAARVAHVSKPQTESFERLASHFKDYSLPVVPIVTDDLDTAVRSFERVNTRATALTQFDIAHALGRARRVDVADLFRQIRTRLEQTGWDTVEDPVLGYAAKLAVGLQVYSYRASTFIEKLAEAHELPSQIADAMTHAVAFLRARCGVYGPGAIPYQFQLVLLCELFRRHAQTPFPALEDGAARWFWMTTFSEHFASQRRIQFALQQLVALAQGDQPQRVVDDPHIDPIGEVRFSRARVKGFLLWFAKTFDPCDPSGASLRAPHELGVRGHETVHALVPRDLVSPEQFSCAGNVLLCPPEAVTSLREALLLHPEHCSNAVLSSHGIVDAARDALVAGRFADFIEARHAVLDAREQSFVTPLGLDYVDGPVRGDDST